MDNWHFYARPYSYDVPENAVFGPYELKHTSVYDSIAFTALKSMDRRTAPYILRVRTRTKSVRLKIMCSKPMVGKFLMPASLFEMHRTFQVVKLCILLVFVWQRPVSIWLHRQTPQRIDGPMWLRLVQSAWSAEEQNLEHYVKNGHLFFRALRTTQKEEERLVWYGKDLAKLLLLNPLQIQSKGVSTYSMNVLLHSNKIWSITL